MKTKAYAAYEPAGALKPFDCERRTISAQDVLIDIAYCGICHTDLHYVQNDWQKSVYPLVPGHEIVGIVKAVGGAVTKFSVGDKVGVGCFVDSCRDCDECHVQQEQFCADKTTTYNSPDKKSGGVTYGGYASHIVVDQHFVLSIADTLDFASTAPLLCAGITTYSPLRHWQIKAGDQVGIVGLGGLGHVAIKIAKAMGAVVTLFSRSVDKIDDAKKLGAERVIISSDQTAMQAASKSLDFILDTVAAQHPLDPYLATLKRDGKMVLVGLPDQPHPAIDIGNLIFARRSIAGSLVGGLHETQEMLDFCAKHNITADIELIKMQEVNQAYQRLLQSDVKYRFVIDITHAFSE